MNGSWAGPTGLAASRLRGALILLVAILLGATSTAAQASPGEVLSHQKVSDTEGSFSGALEDNDQFGRSVASLGDLDGPGPSANAIAVGASGDDDGGADRGAVWVLFLDMNGMVTSHQKISDTQGNFTGVLADGDGFGVSVASLGDLDGNGPSTHAIAVGAPGDDDGGNFRGAVWILFLGTDGTVLSHQKISDTEGGFTGVLDDFDTFGISLASLGDLDEEAGSSAVALAVGAYLDDDGGTGNFADRGAVYILFLNSSGTVLGDQKISATQGGFTGTLDDGDFFGASVASLDLKDGGPGVLAVGASRDSDGASEAGAVWVLFLGNFGTVSAHQKLSSTEGGFGGTLEAFDTFGSGLANLGDVDGDGIDDLAVGAQGDDDGGGSLFADHGAVYVMLMNSDGTVGSHQKISDTEGGFTGSLDDLDDFGLALAPLGDLDGDGFADLAVGASRDDDGGSANSNRGAVWILFLDGMSLVDVPDNVPSEGAAFSQAPNPFSVSTTFGYRVPHASTVRAQIYDSQGRLVTTLLDRRVSQGQHFVRWDGRDHHGRTVPTGVYFARFEIGHEVLAKQVVLTR